MTNSDKGFLIKILPFFLLILDLIAVVITSGVIRQKGHTDGPIGIAHDVAQIFLVLIIFSIIPCWLFGKSIQEVADDNIVTAPDFSVGPKRPLYGILLLTFIPSAAFLLLLALHLTGFIEITSSHVFTFCILFLVIGVPGIFIGGIIWSFSGKKKTNSYQVTQNVTPPINVYDPNLIHPNRESNQKADD